MQMLDTSVSTFPARTTVPAKKPSRTVVFVDGNDLFRMERASELSNAGYDVEDFGCGAAAIGYLRDGGRADIVLIGWSMPGIGGLEFLRRAREAGVETPVLVLAGAQDEMAEETALNHGAADFLKKGRGPAILLRRMDLALGRAESPASPSIGTAEAAQGAGVEANEGADGSGTDDGTVKIGHLDLRTDTCRAFWKGSKVELTLTEFRMLELMARKSGEDIAYREIYDLVHGRDFVAGYGTNGYRQNVRAFIKRIRQKFRMVDATFDGIANYPSFGYRWVAGEAERHEASVRQAA